ncbi:hypothetical protein FA95DRAFT_1609460 [Auriscalpium vulgare]|uniref:Uncharacterized protein n=1 Tax=Auriscalpium vulgare TaxID=40419 RepID=A0ACB8RH55_9AGAM|nr:hypothetical protein FA95DRAFT_1609460 [Auriscalpium vulgare]
MDLGDACLPPVEADRLRPSPLVAAHRLPNILRNAALALKTLDRVELISIIDFDGNVSDLRNLLVTPAPLLEAVDVRIPSESEPIHLPATLFANHAPRLRYISLGNVAPFPWSSPFPTIVSLKLSQPCLTPQSVSELLDTLRNLPMLEELELERCLPVFTQGFAAAADLIAPGNLKKLSLYDDVEKCAGFLQHLRMPWSSVVLHLGCYTDGDATVFRVLYPYIAPVHSPRQITAMEVESSYRGQILFRGHLGEVENICDGPATDAQPDLSLSFGWEDLSAGRTAHMMQELAAVVGVRELRYLHIDLEDSIWSDPPEFPESIWLDTFAACPNLEGIKAEHNSGISLCRVLTAVTLDEKVWRRTDVEDGPLYPTGALIWPELRAISLYRASMNHVYDDGRSLRRVLAQSLRDRDERECPVDALDFLSCQVKPRWHRRFEHIVEEVTCWDDDDEDFEFVDSVEDSEDGGEEAAS